MRGKHAGRVCGAGRKWSIPAHAGETTIGRIARGATRVHPRACGGNIESPVRRPMLRGPSPRMRGKRHAVDRRWFPPGSIPAHAGETSAWRQSAATAGVHPRACGGNDVRTGDGVTTRGPSPRMRGKQRSESHVGLPVHPRACGGNIESSAARRPIPSQRMRGKRHATVDRDLSGSIPAHAGETSAWRQPAAIRGVHPRACGGNALHDPALILVRGPSPRMRGKPLMIHLRDIHPSPRMRGKRYSHQRVSVVPRSIPAHAGETSFQRCGVARLEVHPRACGGN